MAVSLRPLSSIQCHPSTMYPQEAQVTLEFNSLLHKSAQTTQMTNHQDTIEMSNARKLWNVPFCLTTMVITLVQCNWGQSLEHSWSSIAMMILCLQMILKINGDDDCTRATTTKIVCTTMMLVMTSNFGCNDAHEIKQVWLWLFFVTMFVNSDCKCDTKLQWTMQIEKCNCNSRMQILRGTATILVNCNDDNHVRKRMSAMMFDNECKQKFQVKHWQKTWQSTC